MSRTNSAPASRRPRRLRGCITLTREPRKESDLWKQEAMKLRDEDAQSLDPANCRVNMIDPRPSAAARRLRVTIQPDAVEYRPGAAAHVSVRATDAQGRPVAAEISLAAVDQSVFVFGDDNLDALGHVLDQDQPRRLYGIKSWRSSPGGELVYITHFPQERTLVEQAMQSAAAMTSASASAPEPVPRQRTPLAADGWLPIARIPLEQFPLAPLGIDRVRDDFSETAAWLPQLRTGVDGRASATFTLPDSLTAYRLTAVALSGPTQVGVARSTIRALKPLAVRVTLPRFVVQKDRLRATAMVFNASAAPRHCEVFIEMRSATFDAPPPPPGDNSRTDAGSRSDDAALFDAANNAGWIAGAPGGRAGFHRTCDVPARGTAALPFWFTADRPGALAVIARVADGVDSDAQERSAPVLPLGRARSLDFNGAFNARLDIALPAGFVARDLRATLSRGELAQALSGVGALVDDPYGCVEQTMSRFGPAVVIDRAARDDGLPLPRDISARLPGVLATGVARLAHYQHADGGWGWWERDPTSDDMSVYVVDGLARARIAGVAIDPSMLDRGCAFIKQRLASGKLDAELDSRAWLALALARQADPKALAARARRLLTESAPSSRPAPSRTTASAAPASNQPPSRCLALARLALACHAAGSDDLARELWRAASAWRPASSIEQAVRLAGLLAFGDSPSVAAAQAHHLLQLRRGVVWENTRATARAIESLAALLRQTSRNQAPVAMGLAIGGRDLLAGAADAAPFRCVHALAANLPGAAAPPVRLTADSAAPIYYSLHIEGTQQLDTIRPIGGVMKIARHYAANDDAPLAGAVRAGGAIAVRLSIDLARDEDYVMIQDPRPAGCEYADEILGGPDAPGAAHVEFRDDRLCVFFTRLTAGHHELLYRLRAQTPGVSHILPASAAPMYDPSTLGESGGRTLRISP